MTGGASANRYGVITVGVQRVDAFTFDLDRVAHDPDCAVPNGVSWRCLSPHLMPARPAAGPADIQQTISSVQEFIGRLQDADGVRPDRIYIVGESALRGTRDVGMLQERLRQVLEPVNAIEMLGPEQETKDVLRGVLDIARDPARCLPEPCVDMIIIGSSHTDWAEQQPRGAQALTVTGSLPVGTKLTPRELSVTADSEQTFRDAVDAWRTTVLVPQLRQRYEHTDRLRSRRLYMLGGAAWAAATLIEPENQDLVVQLPPRRINELLSRLTPWDSEQAPCSASQRSKFTEVRKVCDVFSFRDLIGGLEILKAFVDETPAAAQSDAPLFFRNSLYALPLGYLDRQIASHAAATHDS